MPLSVTPDQVSSVLLDDGWHDVESFVIGPSPWGDDAPWYEFVEAGSTVRGRRLAGPTAMILRVSADFQSCKPRLMIPAWCGKCNDESLPLRVVEDNGQRVPCPQCHPDPEGWHVRMAELKEQRERLGQIARLRHDSSM